MSANTARTSAYAPGRWHYRNDASKGLGKRSFIWNFSVLPCRLTRITSMSPQNSQRIWRHAPQGGVRTSVSAATATRRHLRAPSEIALKTATRSAHIVRPYVAFSTLQPVKIRPDSSSIAAPTLNFENGAWAFSRTCNAACNKSDMGDPWEQRLQET